jgi:hypothetical protein
MRKEGHKRSFNLSSSFPSQLPILMIIVKERLNAPKDPLWQNRNYTIGSDLLRRQKNSFI